MVQPSLISFIIQNTLYEEVQPSLISFIIQNTLYEDNLMISHILLKLLFKKKSNDFYIQCWWPSWNLNYLKQEQTAAPHVHYMPVYSPVTLKEEN